jgi:hypothetical protein
MKNGQWDDLTGAIEINKEDEHSSKTEDNETVFIAHFLSFWGRENEVRLFAESEGFNVAIDIKGRKVYK